MHFVVAVLAVFNGNILVDLSEKVNIVQVYIFLQLFSLTIVRVAFIISLS